MYTAKIGGVSTVGPFGTEMDPVDPGFRMWSLSTYYDQELSLGAQLVEISTFEQSAVVPP